MPSDAGRSQVARRLAPDSPATRVSKMTGFGRVYFSCLVALMVLCPRPADLAAQGPGHGFLQVGEDRLYYEAAGQGRLVVLLHDGLTHGGIWDAQFRRYADRFRVVRYDRRGHGRSDVPDGAYSSVTDLEALLDHLEGGPAVLVGASAGGRLALDFAVDHPDRVSALVLVGSVVSGYGYSEHFVERGQRNMAPLADGDVEGAVANWVSDPYLFVTEDAHVRKRFRGLLEPYAEKRFLRFDPDLAVDPEPTALARLEALDIPALIVVGEGDVPDVHTHAGAIDSRLRDSRRVVVSGTGHLVAFERPEEFDRLVLEFLRSR